MQAFRKTDIRVFNKETQRTGYDYITIKPSKDNKRIIINFSEQALRRITETGYVELVIENDIMVFRQASSDIGFKVSVKETSGNLAIKNLELCEYAKKYKGKYRLQEGLTIFTSNDKYIKVTENEQGD